LSNLLGIPHLAKWFFGWKDYRDVGVGTVSLSADKRTIVCPRELVDNILYLDDDTGRVNRDGTQDRAHTAKPIRSSNSEGSASYGGGLYDGPHPPEGDRYTEILEGLSTLFDGVGVYALYIPYSFV